MNDITVNGTAITAAAIAEEAQHHPSHDWAAAERAAAEALVVRELLLQEAGREGIAPMPFADRNGRRETEEEAMIRALVRGAVSVPEVDEESLRRFYDNNRRKFRSPDLFEAAHILYPAQPDDAGAVAAATARAEAAIALLRSEPSRFADLARSESACTSASNGGNLGQVSRGQTVPEFETFLVNLEPGQLCPVPVRTRYGIHVLRLDRRIEGQQLPFELVRDRIASYLEQAVWQRAVSQYIRILVGRSEISGIALAGSDGPLVQ
jgi:peptidyl-prolyl cis-trans isomerase C